MFKPTPSKPGLFSVALKRLTALQGSARYAFIPVGLALLFALSFVMTTTPKQAYATPPNTLNFQARLENANGAIVPDGTYNVEFKIYSVSSGGTAEWTEDYLNSASQGVRVVNGYLSVNLGSVTAFSGINWDQAQYLTMNIGGTTTGTVTWDGEMNPRLPLTSVPYAFQAKQAESLYLQGGNTQSLQFATDTSATDQAFVLPDMGAAGTYDLLVGGATGTGVQLQSSTPGTQQTGNFNISGTGIAGSFDSTSGGTLNLGTTNAATINIGTGSYAKTIHIGDNNSAGTSTINIGSLYNGTNTVTIKGGSGGTGIYLEVTTGGTITIGNKTNAWTQNIAIGDNPTAGSTSNVTVGSTVGSSATTIQAGTAGLALTTGTGSSATGALSFTTGDSSGGTAGSITLDTGSSVISGTNVLNDTFEGTGTGSVQDMAAWYNDTVSASNTLAHGGSYSLKVSESSAGWGVIENYGAIPVTAGQQYEFSAWVQAGTAADTIITHIYWVGGSGSTLSLPTVTDSTSGWTQIKGEGIAPAGATSAYLTFEGTGATGQIVYFDDVTATNVSSITVPAINIGAANAQAITIGNTNQAGVTSLLGGGSGVNIAAGTNSTITIGSSSSNNAVFVQGSGVTTKTTTNSTSAFQVQNNSADQVLNVSTTQSSLVSNPSFESGTTNWSASGGSTLSQNTTSSNIYYGTGSLAVALAASGTSGATTSTYTSTLSAGTYSLSFEAKGSAALAGLTASLGSGTCTLNSTSVSTSYAYYYCQNVTTTGSPTITITSTTNSATLYIDAVELDQASTPSSYRAGTANVEGSLVVNGTQAQAASSAFAMTVNELENQQGAGGGLLIQGNSDNLYQNALVIAQKNGNDQLKVNTTTGTTTISGGSSFWGTPAFEISESDAAEPAAVLEGASGQTADILRICSYSATSNCGSILANFDASGNLDIGGTPSSGTPRLYLQQSSDTSLGGIYLANSAHNGGIYLWDDSSQVGYLSSGQTGSKTLDINNGGGAVGIGTSSPSSRLTVTWQSGDSNPTSYFGSNNSSNNQTAVYAENNGGSAGTCASPSIGNENCPAVYGVSVTGDGVRGVTTTTSNTQPAGGVEGLATGTGTAGIGVYGYSSQGIGVEGSSAAGISGFFQANASTNSSPTLVARQNSSGTADLLQAQNSSGTSLFKITSGGLVGVGVASPAVALDVSGAIQQTGMSTPSSGASSGWTELGYCTITSQYQRCETVVNILGGNDGAQSYNTQATVSFRVKQQAAMGSAPYVNVTVNGTAEVIKVSDFEAITTSNTAANTTVQLWGHIEDTYEEWHYTPTLNIPDYTIAGVIWTPNNNGSGSLTATASLPAGTVTTAIYGDSFANTLTVQDSSNTANSFQVQNSSGTSLFNVNASANTVTLLQNAQVSTSSASGCGTNDNFTVADSFTSPTQAARWRVNACGGNLESGGVDLYLSGFTGADFTGTQQFFLRGYIGTAANSYQDTGLFVGTASAATNPMQLVLANKSTSGDPTFVYNGGMYYNSSTQSFMCGQNGAWSDCTGLVEASTTVVGPKSNTSESAFGQTWTALTNDCQSGVVYHITATGHASSQSSGKTLTFYLQDKDVAAGTTSDLQNGGVTIGTDSTWMLDLYLTCTGTATGQLAGNVYSQYNTGGGGGNFGVFSYTSFTMSNGTGGDQLGLAIKWSANPNGTGSGFGAYLTQFIIQRLGAP